MESGLANWIIGILSYSVALISTYSHYKIWGSFKYFSFVNLCTKIEKRRKLKTDFEWNKCDSRSLDILKMLFVSLFSKARRKKVLVEQV